MCSVWKGAVFLRKVVGGWLEVNDRHPELLGDCIILRDEDGIGFCLPLEALVGKYVIITIESTEPEMLIPKKSSK